MTNASARSAWRAVPTSGFKVSGPDGSVPLIQIDHSRFVVTAAFEFDHQATVDDLVGRMVADGMSEPDARSAVDDARTYVPENAGPTDLASIPSFLRWLENTYGTSDTLSAAFARISRAEDSVDKLRVQACEDIAKSRKSNEKIVFEFGHASVAEHAVLSFDLIDVSRLAIEAIEHARLASYTEKSQRYLKLKGLEEVHMPEELHGNRGEFKKLESRLNELLHACGRSSQPDKLSIYLRPLHPNS